MAGQLLELRGRRVAVLGAGVEGVSSARWLARQGAHVTVCDRRSRRVLREVIHELARTGVTDWRFGPRHADRLADFDIVVRTQSRPYLDPRIQRALRDGITVTSMTKLFFERCPAKIVGVTGTKGKGTTSALLASMLQAGGTHGRGVHLGGNIGRSPLDFLASVKPSDVVVLELSSYQLQDLEQSPAVAVVTNVTIDHLDYHATVREYRAAKRPITKFQRRSDIAVLNADDPGSRPFASDPGQVRWFSLRRGRAAGMVRDGWVTIRDRKVLPVSEIRVPGAHNLRNVLAAGVAADALGVSSWAMASAVKKFRGLPYHLEYIGTKHGVRYFNDSYSTNPTAAIPAIESIDGPLVLIAGGAKKGLSYDKMARVLMARKKIDSLRALVAIPPEGTQIAAALRRAARTAHKPVPPIVTARSKTDLLKLVRRHTQSGDTVLFSPAAASFGWFPNYVERGRFFTEQVKSL